MRKNKKFVTIMAMLLAVLMLLSLIVGVIPIIASADEVTQSDIDKLKEQKSQLSGKVQECKERVEALQGQQANVLQQKAALEEQNRLAQEQIDIIQAQIDLYAEMIAAKAKEVDEAKNREERQLQKYRTRVRAMEESGGYNFLTVLLNSSDFSELMSGVDDMEEIMESDRELEEQYVAAREETEEIKASYEAEKAEYEAQQDELQAEQDEIRAQMDEATEMLEALSEEIEKAIEEYKAAEAEEAAAAAEVSNIIALYNQQQAARRAAQQQQAPVTQQVVNPDGSVTTVTTQPDTSTVSGTGSLTWPVPSSITITSRYGNRSDPFTGATAYHSGIDIDGFNKDGQAVVAADSGTVITASTNSGYGNYVIIDHGNMKTVYAHLCAFYVSAGQTVTKGQTIGGLGATGRVTGTHLHFEVYVGDSRTDPAAYFSGMSYYNC